MVMNEKERADLGAFPGQVSALAGLDPGLETENPESREQAHRPCSDTWQTLPTSWPGNARVLTTDGKDADVAEVWLAKSRQTLASS